MSLLSCEVSSLYTHVVLSPVFGIYCVMVLFQESACEHAIGQPSFMESGQCLEDRQGAKVTQELCLPSTKQAAKQISAAVRRTGHTSVYIATDAHPDFTQLQAALGSKVGEGGEEVEGGGEEAEGEGRRRKGEGRRRKGEGRRQKGEGRRQKGEGRRRKGEGRRWKGNMWEEDREGEGGRRKGEGRRRKGEGRRRKGEGRRWKGNMWEEDREGEGGRRIGKGRRWDGEERWRESDRVYHCMSMCVRFVLGFLRI